MNREQLESELGLKLPRQFESHDAETQALMIEYLKSLNKIERKAYSIGIEHLGTSYNMIKSNGFNEWRYPKNK